MLLTTCFTVLLCAKGVSVYVTAHTPAGNKGSSCRGRCPGHSGSLFGAIKRECARPFLEVSAQHPWSQCRFAFLTDSFTLCFLRWLVALGRVVKMSTDLLTQSAHPCLITNSHQGRRGWPGKTPVGICLSHS